MLNGSDDVVVGGRMNLQSSMITPIEEFKALIQHYLSASKGQSVRSLALRAQVPYSNLHRVLNDGRTPRPNEIVSILQKVNQESRVEYFLKKIHPDTKEVNEPKLKVRKHLNEVLEESYADPRYFDIIAEALFSDGVTIDRIKEKYGTDGENRAVELIERGVLRYHEGALHGVPSYSIGLTVIPELIRNATEFFKIENAYEKLNKIFFQTLRVSESTYTGIEEAMSCLRNLSREIAEDGEVSKETRDRLMKVLSTKYDVGEKEDHRKIFLSLVQDDFDLPVKDLDTSRRFQ